MNMKQFAAKLLEDGHTLLADAALDLDASGVKYENLYRYAKDIGVSDIWALSTKKELLDAIVALEQHCEFS